MKSTTLLMTTAVTLVVLLVDPASARDEKGHGSAPDAAKVEKAIADWPDTSQSSASTIMQKYGPPDEMTATMLVWHKRGPWKRTIVYNEEISHNFPRPHSDVLEQFIDYRLPPDKFDEIARYDGSVIAERTKGEISARCDKEELNFLALNLADEIARGKRSVEDARKFYAQTAAAFTAGDESRYTEKLLFEPPAQTADKDETMMAEVGKGMLKGILPGDTLTDEGEE